MRMIGQISDLGLATFCNAEDHGGLVYLIYRVNIQKFIVSNVSRNTVEALQTVDKHPSTFARIKHRSCHDTSASHGQFKERFFRGELLDKYSMRQAVFAAARHFPLVALNLIEDQPFG